MVAAIVADTETTAAPGPTPNSSPAVIVSGTAGRASTSRAVYSAPYAGYLQTLPATSDVEVTLMRDADCWVAYRAQGEVSASGTQSLSPNLGQNSRLVNKHRAPHWPQPLLRIAARVGEA